MGLALMGGFTTSTLLTLLVVPVLFTYVDNLQRSITNLGKKGGKKKGGEKRSPNILEESQPTSNGGKPKSPVGK
jgi:hypothetical protein